MGEDRALELLQLDTGLEPELVGEDRATRLVDVQRLGLPSRPIQRQHELAAKALAQGMRTHESLELSDDGGMPPGVEIRFDSLFETATAGAPTSRAISLCAKGS